MELSKKDVEQFLCELHMSDELIDRCRGLMSEGKYREMYRCLRVLRCDFLDDLHRCQKRLDELDYLLCDIKRKGELSENKK